MLGILRSNQSQKNEKSHLKATQRHDDEWRLFYNGASVRSQSHQATKQTSPYDDYIFFDDYGNISMLML